MRAIFKNNQLHPGNKPKNGKNFKLLAIVAKKIKYVISFMKDVQELYSENYKHS